MTHPLTRTLPVVLMLLVGGCTHTNNTAPVVAAPQPPQSTNAAMQALDDGLYDDAGRRFAQILANNPGHAEARLGMAEVHLAQGRPNEALALFGTLADDPLMGPLGQQGRGLALLAQGRRAQAEQALHLATQGSSTLWRAWNGLGQIADAEMRWDDADGHYAKALAAAPRSAAVLSNMGYSLLLRGRPMEAERPLREALAAEPNQRVAAANLRLALAWQGRYAEALAGVRREDMPSVLNDVGYIALSRGDLDTAEAYLRRAMAASPRFMAQADNNLIAVRAARESKANPGQR